MKKGFLAGVLAAGLCTLALVGCGTLWNNVYYSNGKAAFRQGDYDEAIAQYTTGLQYGTHAYPYNDRGIAYYYKKDYDKAIADYSEAIRLDPDYAPPYNNRGLAYNDKGDYDMAIVDYSEAIRLNPDFTRAYNNRGKAYHRKGDYEKAAVDYEAALLLDPDLEGTAANLALARQGAPMGQVLAQASTGGSTGSGTGGSAGGGRSAPVSFDTIPVNAETDFDAEVTEDGLAVAIVRYKGKSATVNIPATIEGIPVREIRRSAFFESTITHVIIPEGVTTIGERCFYGCGKLVAVILPSTLASPILTEMFSWCVSLTSVKLPPGLTSIGTSAFQYCHSLSSIDLPNGLTSIGENAFFQCESLSSIDLPEGLASIGVNAFFQCESLSSINLPESLTFVGNSAFAGSGLTSVTWPGFMSEIQIPGPNKQLLSAFANCSKLTSVVISEGVTYIGGGLFLHCEALTSVTLPSTIEVIDISAFEGCSSLAAITVPDSVTSIGFEYKKASEEEEGEWGAGSFEQFGGCAKLNLAQQAALRRLGYTGRF